VEYKVIDIGAADQFEKQLNDLVGKGWALVSSQAVGDGGQVRFIAVLSKKKPGGASVVPMRT
jgi:hypothetical protein